jgi:hypothetical protein
VIPCSLVDRCQHLLRVGVADFSEMLVSDKTALPHTTEESSLLSMLVVWLCRLVKLYTI